MLKTVEAEIRAYEEDLRKKPVTVINVDDVTPEFLLESFRPLMKIPAYGANRRPIVETELVPLLAHYANLHAHLGDLLGIMAHKVRHYEILKQHELGKTARTKREILEELRKDVKIFWDTIRSIAYGQNQYIRPD